MNKAKSIKTMKATLLIPVTFIIAQLTSCSSLSQEENYDTAGYDTSDPYGVPSADGYESAPYQPVTPPDDPTYGEAAYEVQDSPAAATPVAPTTSLSTTHTVVKGDTLWGISREYGVSVADIRAANNMDASDSNIRLGSTLNIPAR